MKILFAINNLSVGGAERMIVSQVRAFSEKGYDVHFLTLLPSPSEGKREEGKGKSFDEELRFLGNNWRKFHLKGFLDFLTWWRVYSFLKKEKFDAVITSLFMTNVVVRTCAVLAGVKTIISHEQNIYAEKKWWQRFVDRILARWTKKIVAVSQDVADFTSKQEDIPREKFVINYNAVDIKKFEDIPYPVRHSVTITTAGRLIEQKGQIYLIRAVKKLHEQGIKCSLKIYGEGKLRSELEREGGELPGIRPIKEILAETDIFVLPSLWEGLPLVLVEAMAAGRPIIATRVSGSREMIQDGINGFLVEPKDVDALATKLIELIKNPALCQQFSVAARERAKHFSLQNNIATLMSLIA